MLKTILQEDSNLILRISRIVWLVLLSCLMPCVASAALPDNFECDQVISGYNQTGADGSPWKMQVYDTTMTNGWTVSNGIATITGTGLGPDSGGASIKKYPAWASDGSDYIGSRVQARMAGAGCDFDSYAEHSSGPGMELRFWDGSQNYYIEIGIYVNGTDDVNSLRLMTVSGEKYSDTTTRTTIDVPGLDVRSMNVYEVANTGPNDFDIKVNGSVVYTLTDLAPLTGGDDSYIFAGLFRPQAADFTSTWSTQIDYVRILAAPKTIYVDADASGSDNGTSWADAYNYLADGLAAAVMGNEVHVAQGTYKPDEGSGPTGGDRTATFQLANSVTLKGGYAGDGETDPNERNIYRYRTILSGDINVSDNNSDNSYHVVTGNNVDLTAILDGFIITAGKANGSNPNNKGAGLYNISANPTIYNCTFKENFAATGAGIYNDTNSGPTIQGCILHSNAATSDGGGMYNDSNNTTVTNCTFSDNLADSNGGGLYSYQSCPVVKNSILYGNTDSGGSDESAQVFLDSGTPNVNYSCVQGLSTLGGTGNISTDPFLADIPDQVRLLSHSPCINAGDPAGSYAGQTDIDSEPKVRYNRVDMGADEVFPIAGDFNEPDVPDEDVDWVDLAYFVQRWLDSPCTDPDWCDGADIDSMGSVDFVDYTYFSNHWQLGVE